MTAETYTAKDFATNQDVKWCPGCGDYSILKQVQSILPELNIPKEKIVFISGIGCSSRFPYYMNTFGMHSIHGRATAVASGVKIANPELTVFVITGDGDGLSIGGNHMIHLFRRNINVNVLLFNNEIYGLTKGQYSPTSQQGLKTKSSPMGVIDHPFNPIALALGAEATFIARTLDRNPVHLREMLMRTQQHKGTSFLEIYQNCVIFNDGIFDEYSDKITKNNTTIYVKHNEPMLFGDTHQLGIKLNGFTPEIVNMEDFSVNDLWIHDENDKTKAFILSRMFEEQQDNTFPRPFGVFYSEERICYEESLLQQITEAKAGKEVNINQLISGNNHWKMI